MSNQPQHTIKKAVTFSGIGIHTGETVTMAWKPAPPHHGIKFVRTDLDSKPVIEPWVDNVRDVTRWTTIGGNGAVVHTVEHVLAVLHAFRIDNLLIELDASEPPIGDGSARPFVKLLKDAGIEKQDAPRTVFAPRQIAHVQGGDSLAVVIPSDELRISCTIHFGKKGLDSQFLSVVVSPDTFEREIAPARTFAFYDEIEFLMDKGLIKGGSLENAVVIRGESILATEPLRFPDEFVRHKILDIIGDLMLLGKPVVGHVIAIRPGHGANHALTKELAKQFAPRTAPPMAPLAPAPSGVALDINQLLQILPHRYPFLLVDRIIEIEGDKRIVGLKNVTMNEPFFQGHFPGHPIMPGVLQIEAIAQVAGVLMLKQGENAGKVAYFMSADKVKFRKPVLAGDQLVIEVTMSKARAKIGRAHGVCKVGNEIVSEAEVMFSIIES
jgi:UDP-3-O-[3-hydroxymyristoyl] N-acetylglucosamine deacetylase/3-hydroxyacyl-[acyl-carrier-protein] dehydratase